MAEALRGSGGPAGTWTRNPSLIPRLWFTGATDAHGHLSLGRRRQSGLLAEAVRTLVPTLEKLNIRSAAQVQIDCLADRLRQEVIARRAVAMTYGCFSGS